MDSIAENRCLSPLESKQGEDLKLELFLIRKQEELYWKQRFRLQWLKEGDENTRFFHAVAIGRRNRNFIPSIIFNGTTMTDPRDIGKVFSDRFQLQFGQSRSNRFLIDFRKLLSNRNLVDLSQLDRPFTMEEVKTAVFDLGKDKALGPDGFHLLFFR